MNQSGFLHLFLFGTYVDRQVLNVLYSLIHIMKYSPWNTIRFLHV